MRMSQTCKLVRSNHRYELLALSILTLGSIAYLTLPKLWAPWPDWLDATLNTMSSGFIAAFPFYFCTIYLPQKRKENAARELVRERLQRLSKTINCYFNTINFSPEELSKDSKEFVTNYTKLGLQLLEFSMFYYPYGGYKKRRMSHKEFIQHLANYGLSMLREIKLELPNEVGPFSERVSRAASLCQQIRDTNSSADAYALLPPNLKAVILAFEQKHGALLSQNNES